MNIKNLYLIALISFSFVILVGCTGKGSKAYEFEVPQIDISSQQLADDSIRLQDFSGTNVVLNFWASWCPPCRAETPSLVGAYNTYRDRGVEILGISVWTQGETIGAASDFIREFEVPYLMGADVTGDVYANYASMANLGSLRSPLPMTVFIDKDGYIMKVWPGGIEQDKLNAIINELFLD